MISGSAGLTIILVLIRYSRNAAWWPVLSTMLIGSHPDIAWLTLLAAAITLYLACTPTPAGATVHLNAAAGTAPPGATCATTAIGEEP